MQRSREPLVLRLALDDKSREVLLNILLNYLGEKYNERAIPAMFKNELMSRILSQTEHHEFTVQSMKYSKICTEAILYALCKAVPALSEKI